MALTSAERQRAFRERKLAEGLSALTVIAPKRHHAALAMLVKRLAEDPNLELGALRNTRTGRLEKL